MVKTILMEEFHVTVFVSLDLSETVYNSMRRTLNSKRFQSRLRNAVRKVFHRYPALNRAKFSLSR